MTRPNDSIPDFAASLSFSQATNGAVTLSTDSNLTQPGIKFIYTPNANFFQSLNVGDVGTDSFTYTITDANGSVGTATVNVNISGVNDRAFISGADVGLVTEAGSANNGGTPTASGTLTNTDVDNAVNTFIAAEAGSATTKGYGTYQMTTGGIWTYTLDNTNTEVNALNTNSSPLTDSFTVQTADQTPQTITITINGQDDNRPPVAVREDLVTDQNTILSDNLITHANPAQDSDPDGNPLTVTAITNNAFSNIGVPRLSVRNNPDGHLDGVDVSIVDTTLQIATLRIGGINGNTTDGSIVLTPDTDAKTLAAGQSFTLYFDYTLSDGQGGTSTVRDSVTMNGVNDPVTITSAASAALGVVTEDVAITAPGIIRFSDADTTDTHVVSFSAVNNATFLGRFSVGPYLDTPAGTIGWNYALDNPAAQYLGAGQSVTENFQITIDDGNGSVVQQPISVTINGANDAPTGAASNAYTVNYGQAFTISNAQLIAGFTDVDAGTSLRVDPNSLGFNKGFVEIASDGSGNVILLPQGVAGLSGQLSYRVTDGISSVAASMAITLNDYFNVPGISADVIQSTLTPTGKPIDNIALVNGQPIFLPLLNGVSLTSDPYQSYQVILPSADTTSYIGANGGNGGNSSSAVLNSIDYLPGTAGTSYATNSISVAVSTDSRIPLHVLLGSNIEAGDGGHGGNSATVLETQGGGTTGAGGMGGAGQSVNYALYNQSSLEDFIFGGDQADAGNGGNGGNGAAGDYQIRYAGPSLGARQNGTDGGNGGAGGDGGDSTYTINGRFGGVSGNETIVQGNVGSGGTRGVDGADGAPNVYPVIGGDNSFYGAGTPVRLGDATVVGSGSMLQDITRPGTGGAGGAGGTAHYNINAGDGNDTIIAGHAGLFNGIYSGGTLTSGGSFSTLDGGAGNDTFHLEQAFSGYTVGQETTHFTVLGGSGNDTLVTDLLVPQSATAFRDINFDGGSGGFDTLKVVGATAITLDYLMIFTDASLSYHNLEAIDIKNGTQTRLEISRASAAAVSNALTLYIKADAGDVIDLAGIPGSPSTWHVIASALVGDPVSSGTLYNHYDFRDASTFQTSNLYVEQGATVLL